MNEITKNDEKFMTVKEVAKILNVNERTIQRNIKSIMPEKIVNGKTTYLNEKEVTAIKLRIERSGRNDLDNLAELPKTDLEKELIIQQAIIFQQEKISNLTKENIILNNKVKSLFTQENFTLHQSLQKN